MNSEMYQLSAKHSPADLTILFICQELVSLNSSVVTHANLPTNSSSQDISSQCSILWYKNIKNSNIFKNKLY